MSGIGEQLFTIIGVIVGAVMSYLAGFLSERARANREKAAKLDEHRLSAYAAYGQAVKAMSSLAARIAAARGLNAVMRPLEPDVGLPELDRMATDREIKWEHVLLMGDPKVVAAARDWHQSVWHLEWFARGLMNDSTPDRWEEAVVESGHARDRFYQLARKSIGLSTDPLPKAAWPPVWMPGSGGGTDAST